MKNWYKPIKRGLDILGALALMMVLSPLFLLIMLAIAVDSEGKVLFSQSRMGRNGRPFIIFKFRTMYLQTPTETPTGALSDPAQFITPVGRILRRTSLDELPQLWDVFCGHMSIIGPRPPLPREVVLYTPHQMQRLQVKGGLSCICQVEGRSDMGFEKWVESDLEYIQTRSAGLDLKLVFKTIGVVIMKKGAR